MQKFIKKLDAKVGITLRWLANLLTGNSFKRLGEGIERAERAGIEARNIARRMHDDHQQTMLMICKRMLD